MTPKRKLKSSITLPDSIEPLPLNLQCVHQRQPQNNVNITQNQDQDPPLRRSTRIAHLKRAVELLPSQTAPNKKPRGLAPKAINQYMKRGIKPKKAGTVTGRMLRSQSSKTQRP
ncbi:hypothetical protein GQ44DRAFT_728175 [Phaeosphaeriaceae sp. PMI808]|nr:hypothetical protein GQ44DRAFT_728175 [Phaeosphaeriaceae sp. PMI808]